MNLLQNCDECYQFTLSELPATNITIKGGLTPTTNYILKVTDKFGNKYSSTSQATDGSGHLTVTLGNSFPPQFFNRNAGTFQFELSKTAIPWAPETLTFNSINYTCMLIDFVNDDGGVNVIE